MIRINLLPHRAEARKRREQQFAVLAGLGAVIGSVGLWLARRGTDTRIPFGPFLALGGIAGLVWGHAVVVLWIGRFPS